MKPMPWIVLVLSAPEAGVADTRVYGPYNTRAAAQDTAATIAERWGNVTTFALPVHPKKAALTEPPPD